MNIKPLIWSDIIKSPGNNKFYNITADSEIYGEYTIEWNGEGAKAKCTLFLGGELLATGLRDIATAKVQAHQHLVKHVQLCLGRLYSDQPVTLPMAAASPVLLATLVTCEDHLSALPVLGFDGLALLVHIRAQLARVNGEPS